MKKLFLFAAAALTTMAMQAETASQLWLIGDPVEGGWAPDKGIEMKMTEPGIFQGDFSFDSNKYFAFINELSAAGDWDNMNAHRYGPVQSNMTPEAGVPAAMVYGQDRSFQLPQGEYTLIVNTNTMELTVKGEVVLVMGDLYLRGAMNGWGTSDEYKFTKVSDSVYTYTAASLGQGAEFKIANADWSFSYTSDNKAMELGQTYAVQNQTGDNMALASAAENVTLTLDIDKMTLKVEGKSGELYVPETLYMIGNVNGVNWSPSASLEMTKNGNVFTANGVELKNTEAAADDIYAYFSFITVKGDNWDVVNESNRIGAPSHDEMISPEASTGFSVLNPPYTSGANSWKVESGVYNVTVDFDNGKVSVEKGVSSAAEIAVEPEGAAVYYNLQGIRVANPENGLYIRVKAGKSQVVKL